LAELVKGTPPNDMDITGPRENQRDMDGGQASHTFEIRPRSQPATASAFYDVEQHGQRLGTFRIDFNLGAGGDPNNLLVACNEQDSPECWDNVQQESFWTTLKVEFLRQIHMAD
jgi:hypothetical protein